MAEEDWLEELRQIFSGKKKPISCMHDTNHDFNIVSVCGSYIAISI